MKKHLLLSLLLLLSACQPEEAIEPNTTVQEKIKGYWHATLTWKYYNAAGENIRTDTLNTRSLKHIVRLGGNNLYLAVPFSQTYDSRFVLADDGSAIFLRSSLLDGLFSQTYEITSLTDSTMLWRWEGETWLHDKAAEGTVRAENMVALTRI